MPSFRKPKFSFNFNVNTEISNLLNHKKKRKIPDKDDSSLLIATWNIANLGLQDRWNEHYQMIAEIISWFDVIAIQEVHNNLSGIRNIESSLPSHYSLIFSDKGGNNERSAFIFDSRKIKQMELVGEIAISPKDHKYIKVKGFTHKFNGFDRNPFLASFEWQNFSFILISVHSFFGSTKALHLERRALEAYAIARYAWLHRKSKNAFSKNIITLGDFNLPKISKEDIVYKALLSKGLQLPKHSTKVYSNIANDKQYDQIAFLPALKSKIQKDGVFDFDSAIFSDLWKQDTKMFKAYLRYFISDHRPMWIQLKL